MKAIWNGTIVAESDQTIEVEGYHYFPPDSVNMDYFQSNYQHTICGWKGIASYYDLIVEGETNPSAAWYYPETTTSAENIKDYIAFWRGVEVK